LLRTERIEPLGNSRRNDSDDAENFLMKKIVRDLNQMIQPPNVSIGNALFTIALTVALGLAGCGPNPAPPPSVPHPNHSTSGSLAWPSWAKDNPLPGVDHAAAYACWDDHVVYVIWTDFDTSSGGTSGPTMDGVYRANLTAERGTQVRCECKTRDGISGTMRIHVDAELVGDASYDLQNGNLFLIATRGDAPTVTQLDRTVFDTAVEDAKEDVKSGLRELAVTDVEVNSFLTSGSDGMADRP
jgi:hypothetical protein